MDSKFLYTNERNVQIVIALLKAHGIRRVIASPGTTNMTFVVSVQNDPWFQVWSSVDERSAAYLACGLGTANHRPVGLLFTTYCKCRLSLLIWAVERGQKQKTLHALP